jgi:hypothetical protein
VTESPLPDRPDNDTDRVWGDESEEDDEERLESERPPHYDDR